MGPAASAPGVQIATAIWQLTFDRCADQYEAQSELDCLFAKPQRSTGAPTNAVMDLYTL
jgi:hypothetical protein